MIAIRNITEQLRMCIAQARVKFALEELLKLANHANDAEFLNQVILISSAYHELKFNVLTQDENADVDNNKIIMALLSLIEQLPTFLPESIDYQILIIEENSELSPKSEQPTVASAENISEKTLETTSKKENIITQQINNEPIMMAVSSPQKAFVSSFPAFNHFYANVENSLPLPLPTCDDLLEKALILYRFETTGKIEKGNNIIEDNNAFQTWLQSKRAFSVEELQESVIIKLTQAGQLTKINMQENGKLSEASLRDMISHKWEAEWSLEEGILSIHISDYQSSIFASATGIIHSGVEYIENDRAIIHNLIIMPKMDKVLYV